MCLYALQRYALRIQPLFLSVQLMVLVLSLFLPSSFIVIFSTVLIERFITTVQKEITTADQRSGIRAPTSSSSQNFIEEVRRQRRQRQHAAGGAAKRARSVSMVSDTTMPSEVSRNSSLVRQYKMHPEWHKERSLEAVRQDLGRRGVGVQASRAHDKLVRIAEETALVHTEKQRQGQRRGADPFHGARERQPDGDVCESLIFSSKGYRDTGHQNRERQ
ncbi:hypothetical protein V5799_005274 [Amblyomma americanum]|uniref:Uncharacterized protein n=1 Tax=Amblyomma americanum TaxID=6943 RepID=A0AAQ4DZQ1_AMBAM